MKQSIKFFLAILALFSYFAPVYAITLLDDDDKDRIPITGEIITGQTHQIIRSELVYVDAFYFPSADYVNLIYVGIGDADVYIVNSENEVQCHERLYEGSNSMNIYCQLSLGSYTLIIESDCYYGEGSFNVL